MSTNDEDGFDDFSLEQIGLRAGAFGGARLLKFVTDKFVTREGEVIGPERRFISLGLVKVVQKFVDKKLVDTIIVPSGKKMPDVDEMNEKAPREEWGADLNGQPTGPYVRVLVLKFIEEPALTRYAFVTSSIGGSIAVGDLSDKIKILRRLRGPDITAVVSPRTTLFKTKFSVRKRPDFYVLGPRRLGGDDGGGQPLPRPKGALTLDAPVTPTPEASPMLGTPVESPTLREEMADEVLF
jgi:hypothetical protein